MVETDTLFELAVTIPVAGPGEYLTDAVLLIMVFGGVAAPSDEADKMMNNNDALKKMNAGPGRRANDKTDAAEARRTAPLRLIEISPANRRTRAHTPARMPEQRSRTATDREERFLTIVYSNHVFSFL
jgi:hypothetical protein